MKNYYPIFLDLRSKPVLILGGGRVALRKAKGLLEAGARVTIIAPEVSKDLRAQPVAIVEREYRRGDCVGQTLVFAATSSRLVNSQIGREAAAAGVPSNIADAPNECGFIVPARFTEAGVQVAVSSWRHRSKALGIHPRRHPASVSSRLF